MSKLEIAIGLFTLASLIGSFLIFIWRLGNSVATMQAELKSQFIVTDFDRQKNDLRLESLHDKLELGLNGLKERFDHFSMRSRNEYKELETRTRRIENFMQRSFEQFEP